MGQYSYQEVMHHLGRMCETYSSCSHGCPLQKGPNVCFLSAKAMPTEEIKATEQAVMKWAAEHPEPVYETWLEFIKRYETGKPKSDNDFIYWMGTTPIPADIAEKLEIEPKEG